MHFPLSYRASLASTESVCTAAASIAAAAIPRAFAGRPGTVQKARGMLVTMMGTDDAAASVIAALLTGTEQKNAKVPPECIRCVTAAYVAFGASVMPNEQVLAKLKTLMEVKAALVRNCHIRF